MKRRFCWDCGQQLWGNVFSTLIVHGYPVVLHKDCAKEIQRNPEITAQPKQAK